MPLYKCVGNQILTRFQNRLLGISSQRIPLRLPRLFGQRAGAHSLRAQHQRFPFRHRNHHPAASRPASRIKELPIPTYYGDEICHVNGLKYAWDVFKTTMLRTSTQDLESLYDRKFDVQCH